MKNILLGFFFLYLLPVILCIAEFRYINNEPKMIDNRLDVFSMSVITFLPCLNFMSGYVILPVQIIEDYGIRINFPEERVNKLFGVKE